MIVCSGTLGGQPLSADVSFEAKVRVAAAAGFTGISIYAREYEPHVPALLRDLGLTVAEVDGAMAWMPGQPGEEVERVLDIAAELPARSVTVLDLSPTPLDLGKAAEAFAALCEKAATAAVAAHIEPFPWSGIATVGRAAEIVRRAGQANGGILVDTWHLVRGPDAGRVDAGDAPLVMAVQVSDPAPTPGPDLRTESMTGRRLPGPVAAGIVAELRRLGSDAPLEVEVFGRDLELAERARVAYDALRALEL